MMNWETADAVDKCDLEFSDDISEELQDQEQPIIIKAKQVTKIKDERHRRFESIRAHSYNRISENQTTTAADVTSTIPKEDDDGVTQEEESDNIKTNAVKDLEKGENQTTTAADVTSTIPKEDDDGVTQEEENDNIKTNAMKDLEKGENQTTTAADVTSTIPKEDDDGVTQEEENDNVKTNAVNDLEKGENQTTTAADVTSSIPKEDDDGATQEEESDNVKTNAVKHLEKDGVTQEEEHDNVTTNAVKDLEKGRRVRDIDFIITKIAHFVKIILNNVYPILVIFCAIPFINGLTVPINSAEHQLKTAYEPNPIIFHETVSITCSSADPIDKAPFYTWIKKCKDDETTSISLNNIPTNETRNKYLFRLSNGNRSMEIDILHFGLTDFCNYECQIGLYMIKDLNLTSKAKYLIFPQHVQPSVSVTGQLLKVSLHIDEVYPLPKVTFLIQKLINTTLTKTEQNEKENFNNVWMKGSTIISNCPKDVDLIYLISIELEGRKRSYKGTILNLCLDYHQKRNDGVRGRFSPTMFLLCLLASCGTCIKYLF